MKNKSDLSKNLRIARAKARLSQKKLSELSGVSSVQISRYESDFAVPRAEALEKIAAALNVDIADLFLAREGSTSESSMTELHIPRDLNNLLVAASEGSGNSLNAEILIRLSNSFRGANISEQHSRILNGQLEKCLLFLDKTTSIVNDAQKLIERSEENFL